ncbi:DoxX family membrane protein [Pedobacter sp. L105]|uniref:DoxX family membrane protein n=1 Tax=Pedobacter sp. L105 TaxID=1641871 RepID=UPI00131C7477|nr:DoxX family membrane protein [Pedobacter sp. L105]
MRHKDFSYLLARLPLGMSLFGHGLARLPKLTAFSHWMTGSFSKSILPQSLVQPFSYALPVIEFTIGILLLLGLFTHLAILLGVVTMLALIFGSSLLEQWENVFIQLIYGIYFALLYRYVYYNRQSFDQLIIKHT